MCIVAGLYRRIRNRLEERVAERTRELTSANAMLRQYVELIDHAGDALIVRDMQGTIIFWNRGATSLYGWTVTEAMGMSIHTLLKTKGLPTDINDFLEQNKHWEGELLQQTRGGRIVTVEARKTCVIAGEGRALVLESLRDITERKQAEDALHKSSDDLARSNKDLEQFAYVASHDLQEPLRAVGGFMGLLKRQNQDSLNAEALEFINFAIEGAERMQALIQDLLAFSRVGAKGNVFTDVSLEEAFANALKNLHSPVEETNAIVTHDTLPIVKADLPQMIQLFQNLLQNAIKFHGLRRPEVHVTALQKDNDWVIGMRDNGIGIDQKYFERIFLIFQRLHTRSQYSGTGIGLSVCKKIVERHGGSIWVESTPGVGSTFYFSIPKVAGFAEKGVLS
jgi:PAS domain S-box-containing protein